GGLIAAGSQFWTQDSSGIADVAEKDDAFGQSVAAANFGKDSHADLAIAAAGEQLGANAQCGVVHVLYGSPGGLTATGSQLWSQNSPGVKDQCDPVGAGDAGDVFGFTLAGADLGHTSQADLAISAPGEDLGSILDGGVVQVLY